jgi:hypothetical protein
MVDAASLRVSAPAGAVASMFVEGHAVEVQGLVEVSGRDAALGIDADRIDLLGDVRVIANGPAAGDFATLSMTAFEGMEVDGELSASAGLLGQALVDLSNGSNYGGGSGDILLKGPVNAIAGGGAAVSVSNSGGDVRVAGSVEVQQTNAGVPGQATLYVSGNEDIDLSGPLLVSGKGPANPNESAAEPTVSAAVYGGGKVDIRAPATVKGADKTAVYLSGKDITVGARFGVEGAAGTRLHVSTYHGSIRTDGAGLLAAPEILFYGYEPAALDVRTQAGVIGFGFEGEGLPPPIRLDNTANLGPTLIIADADHGSSGGSVGGPESAGGAGPIDLSFHGDVTVTGEVTAQNAIFEVTNGFLHFEDSVLIGSLNLPPEDGDAQSLLALSQARRPDGSAPALPRFEGAPTTGANAVFEAKGGIRFDGGLAFDDPDTPYVAFITDGPLDLGPGVASLNPSAVDFLAQFTAYTAVMPIAVEQVRPASVTGVAFTVSEHFSKWPGTTLIIGNSRIDNSPAAGDITVGSNGTVDIGDQNILFATGGRVSGLSNLRSTGFVGELNPVAITEQPTGKLGEEFNQSFPLPFAGDIRPDPVGNAGTDSGDGSGRRDEDKDEDYVDIDDSGEGESSGLVAQRDNSGQMCQ